MINKRDFTLESEDKEVRLFLRIYVVFDVANKQIYIFTSLDVCFYVVCNICVPI